MLFSSKIVAIAALAMSFAAAIPLDQSTSSLPDTDEVSDTINSVPRDPLLAINASSGLEARRNRGRKGGKGGKGAKGGKGGKGAKGGNAGAAGGAAEGGSTVVQNGKVFQSGGDGDLVVSNGKVVQGGGADGDLAVGGANGINISNGNIQAGGANGVSIGANGDISAGGAGGASIKNGVISAGGVTVGR